MQKMKLYFSPASPYARKVMVTAHEVGLADRIETVATQVAPHTPNREYAAHNPLMKVPALELADGRHLVDSVVICEYLDDLAGGGVFPRAGDARWDALRLHAVADGIVDASLLARYESALRPPEKRWPEWLAGQLAKVDSGLDALEREVARWADALTIGQVGAACALGYLDFRFADRPWRASHPRLAQWFEATMKRDSLRLTAPS